MESFSIPFLAFFQTSTRWIIPVILIFQGFSCGTPEKDADNRPLLKDHLQEVAEKMCACCETAIVINQKLEAFQKKSYRPQLNELLQKADEASREVDKCINEIRLTYKQQNDEQERFKEKLRATCPSLPEGLLLRITNNGTGNPATF